MTTHLQSPTAPSLPSATRPPDQQLLGVVEFEDPTLVQLTHPVLVLARARLDNTAELARLLGSPSDPSVHALLLRAYDRWGESCPTHLLGDYAFAIWDPRRRLLYAARDPFGVEPLFFWATAERAAVALRLHDLFGIAGVTRAVHRPHLHQLIDGDLETAPETTAFQGIYRVRQGHHVCLAHNGVRQERHWRPEDTPEVRLADDREYAAALRELLQKAVCCRMPPGGNVGAFLSGGLDSSSIAALARDELRARGEGPLPTFTLTFNGLPRTDERQFAAAVVASGGFRPEFIRGDLLDSFASLARLQAASTDMLCVPNLHLHAAVYATAAGHGVHVLLDGFDGDTAISHGLGWIGELAGTGRTVRAVAEAVALRWRSHRPLAQLLGAYLLPSVLSPRARRWLRMVRRRGEAPMPAPPHRTERSAHEARLGRPLIGLGLEAARFEAERHGIEPRYPFFDQRLVAFCLGLPPEQKLRWGWTRLVLRRAVEGLLPSKVQWRRQKSDLAPAFVARLRANEGHLRIELARAIDDLGLADAVRWTRTLAQASSDETGASAVAVWRVLAVAEWCRREVSS